MYWSPCITVPSPPLQVVRNTWRNETYILHQCGADSQDHIQAAKESFPGAKHFTIPLNAVSAPDTSVLDFMVRLPAYL